MSEKTTKEISTEKSLFHREGYFLKTSKNHDAQDTHFPNAQVFRSKSKSKGESAARERLQREPCYEGKHFANAFKTNASCCTKLPSRMKHGILNRKSKNRVLQKGS